MDIDHISDLCGVSQTPQKQGKDLRGKMEESTYRHMHRSVALVCSSASATKSSGLANDESIAVGSSPAVASECG